MKPLFGGSGHRPCDQGDRGDVRGARGVGPDDPDAVAGGVALDRLPEAGRSADRGAADAGDPVAGSDAGAGSRRTGVADVTRASIRSGVFMSVGRVA